MTDPGWVFSILAVVACGAWVAAEVRIDRLQARADAADLRSNDLRFQYEAQCSELRSKRQLLTEALAAMPDTPRGRELGDAIRFSAWPGQNKQRLERHLQLVDRKERG